MSRHVLAQLCEKIYTSCNKEDFKYFKLEMVTRCHNDKFVRRQAEINGCFLFDSLFGNYFRNRMIFDVEKMVDLTCQAMWRYCHNLIVDDSIVEKYFRENFNHFERRV